MLESGTKGTQGNTQIVVPKVTENYGASRDAPEDKTAMPCTIKNFPYLISHTLQWAVEWFDGIFRLPFEDINQFISNPGYIEQLRKLNEKNETMERMLKNVKQNKPETMQDCVIYARLLFEEIFSNMIKQLLHNFPADKLTDEGLPYWSGNKKPPAPLIFSNEDPLHLDFVRNVANIRAANYGNSGIRQFDPKNEDDEAMLKVLISNVEVPEFRPKDGIVIKDKDEENKEGNSS